jgi:hypothetical protein
MSISDNFDPGLLNKIVIAVVWFFVGMGVMLLALRNRVVDDVPVKQTFTDIHQSIKRAIQ